MTNPDPTALRARAANLRHDAIEHDTARMAALVAGDFAGERLHRSRAATARAEASEALALAEHLDAVPVERPGLAVPMTRETGGTVEAPADVDNPDDPDGDLDDLDVREAMRVELARALGIGEQTAASVWGNLVDQVRIRERQREALLRDVE